MDDSVLADLFDKFGHDGNFNLFSYYARSFDLIPSSIRLNLPQEGSREILTIILQQLELEKFSFQPILKNWRTTNAKNANDSDDYVHEYVFRSNTKRILIHLVAQRKHIQLQFLYDLNDTESETWILDRHHTLRTNYGEEKKPGFKVLVMGDGRFYTDDIDTLDFESVDINELYNDDFIEVDQIISNSIQKQSLA